MRDKIYFNMSSDEKNNASNLLLNIQNTNINAYLNFLAEINKLLIFLNSGAIMLVVSYLSKKEISSCSKIFLFISSIFYLAGLIFSILVIIKRFFWLQNVVGATRKNVEKFFKNELSLSEVTNISYDTRAILFLGIISMVIFGVGITFTLIGVVVNIASPLS